MQDTVALITAATCGLSHCAGRSLRLKVLVRWGQFYELQPAMIALVWWSHT